nr:MAG TPA: hypothetical protein [Caudoviricetes sp.]
MGREALHASHALHPRRGVPIPRRGPRTPGRGWVHGGTRRQCGSSVPRESRGLLCLSGLRADFRCEDAAGLDAPHSFGRKALERFARNTSTHRYWEDRWLKEHGLSRGGLLHEVRDRSQHPLAKFLYPEYEDATKCRRIGTEAGLYVCSLSTLLWTPLSPVCRECTMAEKCREMTCERYPELYRLRVEHGKQGGRS